MKEEALEENLKHAGKVGFILTLYLYLFFSLRFAISTMLQGFVLFCKFAKMAMIVSAVLQILEAVLNIPFPPFLALLNNQ